MSSADLPRSPRVLSESDLGAVLAELGVTGPTPVVVVIGGASHLDADDAETASRRSVVTEIISGSLRPVVQETGAVVLTGGTDAGVMRIAGAELGDVASALVGVAPAAKVTGDAAEAQLDQGHTAAVLTAGARWGSETETLFDLAEACTGGSAPGLVVLANGGPTSFEEARRFLRGGWPIATVAGTGGAADSLVAAVAKADEGPEWGDLQHVDVEVLAREPVVARRQLRWRLHEDQLLKAAWATFASWDRRASELKAESRRGRVVLTILTSMLLVAVTASVQFAVLGWTAGTYDVSATIDTPWRRTALAVALTVAKWTVIAVPIGLAVAAAIGNFSGSQTKWRVVRSSAETLKREIYRYRASRGIDAETASARLAAVLHVVDDEAIRAGVGLVQSAAVVVRARPDAVDPDELESLTAKIYLKHRLERQVLWFGRSAGLGRRDEWRLVVAGAVAAAVAVGLVTTRFAAWVAVLVLVATAFAVSRERGLARQQVAGFDRAVADVNDAWIAWLQRPLGERSELTALAGLVEEVEGAFERESLSWGEVMRRAADQAQVRVG